MQGDGGYDNRPVRSAKPIFFLFSSLTHRRLDHLPLFSLVGLYIPRWISRLPGCLYFLH
ncbi:unnamed protein product [Penicillium roqueforti FM164]|uniref:Uncharacterized protein n=1 Tax=Penicillium roqueforti (strain FM164) TaxID=1365484 RepID=W6QNT7_PENRF|nr:unnamed protein product [Penicillium roqueforti FM164]